MKELLKIGREEISNRGLQSALTLASKHAFTQTKYRIQRAVVDQWFESISAKERERWIDPEDIDWFLVEGTPRTTPHRDVKPTADRHELEKAYFNTEVYKGVILPGEWDKFTKPYEYDQVYRAIKAHYVENIPWEKTEYGQRLKLGDRANPVKESDFSETMFNRIDTLYHSIDENGFVAEKCSDDPVSVLIDRNGDLIFNNSGHHRLAISKVLDVDEIKVSVAVVHSDRSEQELEG